MPNPLRLIASAEGALEKTPLVHLLVYVADRMLSGSMVLTEPGRAPGEEHTIYFFQGSASKIRTGEPIAHLGRVLYEVGFITEDQLNASLQALGETGELHGEHLVRAGAIDRSQLMRALATQLTRKMAFLFALPSKTTFAFYEGTNLLEDYGGPEVTPLDPLPTIWSAVCARADEPIVDLTLSRLGETPLRLHEQADPARFGFSPQQMAVVDFIRARPSSFRALITSELLPERMTKLLVYALLVTRHLDHRADGAGPVGVERLTDTARMRIAAAMSGVPVARLKLTARRPDGTTEPSPEPAATPARTPAPPPPAPRVQAGDLAARRETISKRAATIDREDYFSILGVTDRTTPAEIQQAYYALAKVWHPDRLAPELVGMRDVASRVFARMSEAFETLSDPARRERYIKLLKGGSGTPEEAEKIQKIIDAATDFQRAEILWKRRDPAAEELIERAYRADPEQSDYIALWATLQLSKRGPEAPVDDLIKVCDHAIALSERCERAYFCRAALKKRIGKIESAMSDFRTAYELNPKNLDAAREVRLYEMRRAKDPERRSSPAPRRSTTPPPSKSTPSGRSTPPGKKPSNVPQKDGGVLSGIGKLFKR